MKGKASSIQKESMDTANMNCWMLFTQVPCMQLLSKYYLQYATHAIADL